MIYKTHEWKLDSSADVTDPQSGWGYSVRYFECIHCGALKELRVVGPDKWPPRYIRPHGHTKTVRLPTCSFRESL